LRGFDPAAAFQRVKELKKEGKEGTEEFRKLHHRLGLYFEKALD